MAIDKYVKRAEELLQEANRRKVGKREKGFMDNKMYINEKDISALIGAGAKVLVLNSKTVDGTFVHEFEYKGYWFISATNTPYVPKV